MRNVFFYRDFIRFSGGHRKVWHYFNHVLSAHDYEAWIRFSRRSVWDESNPWKDSRSRVLEEGRGVRSDILFLAGLDWLSLSRRRRIHPRCPVINLVQHVRHAHPEDPRYRFLGHPAVRVCVSPEVADAISSTSRVNGPIVTIPNGIDLKELPDGPAPEYRETAVLVVANKAPELGRRLAARLARRGREVQLIDRAVSRRGFLERLRHARATLFVPHRVEGFYLPALEGMALGTLVVCPDCLGNRSFCKPDENCLRPEYSEEAMLEAAERAVDAPGETAEVLTRRALATAREHDLENERRAFLEVLADLSTYWSAA